MLGRLSLAAQATVIASTLLVALYFVQLVWLAHGGEPRWVMLLTVVCCSATVWGYTKLVHFIRLRRLEVAFERLAGGDLDTELAKPTDADTLPLGRAWSRMRGNLRDMTDRLRRVDVARRELFADLAHELGTPIGTVLALADALALPEVEASPERRRDLVAALLGEALRLARLVGDLRDLADLDDPGRTLARTPTDVAALVRDVARRLALARPESARIEVEAPDTLVAEVDPERMEQVMINVLANAQRYTPAGGSIRVHVESTESTLRLTVDDSGQGVPDALLPRLGERMVRLDASRSRQTGGSGLGLSIVRAIVQRHEGEVLFERAPLGGLRVAIAIGSG
jgi:two-component system, OmpR family, sensor histidine kinase BaeS